MAAQRVEIPEVVLSTSGTPVAGASVQVNIHGGGAATIYAAETGGTTTANPIITDANGRIEGWIAEGSYDLVISATGFATYTQYYEAVKGSNSAQVLASTTGDIVYASAANTLARLGIGSSGQFLTVSGGLPAWAAGTVDTRYKLPSAVDVVNTVTETSIVTQSIAANVMGTDRLLRCTAIGDWLPNGAAAAGFTLKVKFGGTTFYNDVSSLSGPVATRVPWTLLLLIGNQGAANAQFIGGFLTLGNFGAVTTGLGDMAAHRGAENLTMPISSNGAGTIDTTNAQTLDITITNTAAHASISFRKQYAIIEILG